MTQEEQSCACEGCHRPAYTGNALALNSSIGTVVVFVCAEHFAEYLQVSMAARHVSVSMEKLKEQKA